MNPSCDGYRLVQNRYETLSSPTRGGKIDVGYSKVAPDCWVTVIGAFAFKAL
jgi:hypothetical protein